MITFVIKIFFLSALSGFVECCRKFLQAQVELDARDGKSTYV